MRGHIARARDYQQRIDRGEVESASELARGEGITRARVCQLLRLLRLAPEVLADVESPDSEAPMVKEAVLRKLAGIEDETEQMETYRRLLAEEGVPRRPARHGARPEGRVRRRGLQHVFAQARRYAAMLESGDAGSYAAIGRQEGISGARVGQIVLLLHLDPDILTQVDVPAEELPAGVSERKLRAVARLEAREEQLEAFASLAKG